MSKPNMYCGECPYWLAYGEPETTDEQNEAILAHCAECDFDPEAEEARQEAHDNLIRSLVEAGGTVREARELLARSLEWLYMLGYDSGFTNPEIATLTADINKFLEDTK